MITQVILNAVVQTAIYVIMALGLTLIFGVMKIPNLTHGAMYAMGAFIHYSLIEWFDVPFVPALFIAAPLTFGGGAILERVFFRSSGSGANPVIAIIAGIGLTYVLVNVMTNVWGAWPLRIQTPFSHVLRIGSGAISSHNVVTTAVAVSITALLYALLKWTKFGCAIRAVSQDREEASLIGVNVNTVGLVTFAIGTMLASIGGMFAAPINAASPTMGGTAETMGFAIIILGGMGSLGGAIVGACLLGFVDVFVTSYVSGGWGGAVAFVFMIVVILIRPSGLFGKKGRQI
jgi:branched-chain amino acid transport system permease protein